jgi:hypothetical protein
MNGVRVLVGTRKGAFIFTSNDSRTAWQVSEPLFAGWEVYHIKASSADPQRIYAAYSTAWFGQIVQRSDDGGATWETVGNEFKYSGEVGPHTWYDGTPHPWEFRRVWHLEPHPTERDTVYAGVEDAALFVSKDAGVTWTELSALRTHESAPRWTPGAGGLCLHTIVLDPSRPERIYTAISASGCFRSDDSGASWTPINRGLVSSHLPEGTAEVGHCVHRIALHPSRPETLFMQKHWDVMRSDNGGDDWREISGNLPTDFGFVVGIDPGDPERAFVIPIKSDSEHFPPEGKLRVYALEGEDTWHALTVGLPQENFYGNVLRDALATDTASPGGIYFGTTSGAVYASRNAGASFETLAEHLPAVLSVEVAAL